AKHSLRRSLELRYQIYCALGYLSESVRASRSRIELDCYDPTAIHYAVASHDDPGRVVASMRLIIPGTSPLMSGIQPADYPRWCHELANDEPSRVFRELLRRRYPNALPALDSFNYFTRIKDQPRFKELVLPRNSCEISRVVVDPQYRGRGLLKLLMEKAIGTAARNRRRYLLLECAPFHEPMYRKFGFQLIEDDGQRYYVRERRLDAWVVAMYRELKDHDAEGAREDHDEAEKLYGMSIHDARGREFTLTLECENLDLRDIRKCLSLPYPPPAAPKPGSAYVPKTANLSLGCAIRTAFKQLDPPLEPPLREFFRLLPKAQLKLRNHAGREFIIEKAHCELGSTESPLRDRVSHWLG
ncbi:MAG: GNAT family N-acetyltransferase, partial [Gammaproteobacteria bacterium]